MANNLIKRLKKDLLKLDAGHQLTERQLSQLERKIGAVYADAAKEISATINKYWRGFYKRDAEMRARLEDGEIDKQYYKAWLRNQIGRGERFERMREELVTSIHHVNEIANGMINEGTLGVYVMNRNYTSYIIEKVHPQASFTLYNKAAIKRILLHDPNLMPYYPPLRALKRGIDLAYGEKIIRRSITQGILQGHGIKQIEKSMRDRIVGMNRESSIRAARTAYTNAQNGGRLDQMLEAQAKGIRVEKQWLSTSDGRTRDSHVEANGEIRALNEKFSTGLMHPADREGRPEEVYNCRCTMLHVINGQSIMPDKLLIEGATTQTAKRDFLDWSKRKGGKADE